MSGNLLHIGMAGLGLMMLVTVGGGIAQAQQPLPWGPRAFCTIAEGKDAGGDPANCTYYTWEQCMATARGNGQSCMANPFYHGAAAPPAPVRRHRHHRS